MITIQTADFITSSSNITQCPTDGKPEFAFIGRSNVGKSSLINMLTGRASLAKTSFSPGKTILINHFLINQQWYLVDLPGYGFAKRSKIMQQKFQRMIDTYVRQRETLFNLFLLIDSSITPQQIDLSFIQFLGENQVPFSIVFTKTDKSRRGSVPKNIQKFLSVLKETWEELPPYYSVSSRKNTGRDELLTHIEEMLAAK